MKSIYIIKPDGMFYRDKIRAMILNAGLKIVRSKIIHLTPNALHQLYPDVSSPIMNIIYRTMLGPLCEIGQVEGKNAIGRLVTLCGEKTNPEHCAEGTIRRTFMNYARFTRVGNETFYENTIHRSKNKGEAKRDLELYESLDPASS